MRYISYSLISVAILIMLSVLLANWLAGSAPEVGLDDDDYKRVIAYSVPQESTVNIDFSSSATTTKLLFYALVSGPQTPVQNGDNEYFRFSIEYRFGQAGDFNKIDLSTRLSDYRSLETNQPKPAYRLVNEQIRVTDSRSLAFSIPVEGRPSLELRLASKDANIEGVVFRSYYQENTSNKDSLRRWARLSRSEQNRLARFHPFGREYLSQAEIQNVLSNRNQVIAPSGVSGKDFEQRPLWSYQYPDLLTSDSGIDDYAAANLGGELKQSLRLLKNAELEFSYRVIGAKTTQINYWHKMPSGGVRQGFFEPISGEGNITHNLTAGDYIFYADQAIDFEILSSEGVELSQQRRRFYRLSNSGVSYRLVKSDRTKQAIKVEVIAAPNAEVELKYEFTTESGVIVLSDIIRHQQPLNAFSVSGKGAQLNADTANANLISLTTEQSITVPDNASALLIVPLQGTGLVRLSNSLGALPSKVILSGTDTQYHSNWFELKPAPADSNSTQNFSNALVNPGVNPIQQAIWVSSFDRFAFMPNKAKTQVRKLFTEKSLPAFDLFEPVTVYDPVPASAIAYKPVAINRRFDFQIDAALEGDQTIVMRAFYLGKDDSVKTLSITIDDRTYTYSLLGKTGLISLPPLTIGNHSLTIETPKDIKFYLNHLAMGAEQGELGFKQRQFSRLTSQALYPVQGLRAKDQSLQVLLASTRALEPFNLNVVAKNPLEQRLVRRIEVVPQQGDSHTEMLHLSGQEPYTMLPAIYVPLATLGDFAPTHLEIMFEDDQSRLISAALLDNSGIHFNRSFSDNVGRASKKPANKNPEANYR